MPERSAQDRLVADGYLLRGDGGVRTTPRWQAAMARAALGLQRGGAPWTDLRLPVAAALLERYAEAADGELVSLVEEMVRVEAGELAPLLSGPPGAAPPP